MLFRAKTKNLYKSFEIKSARDIWQIKEKYGGIEQYQEQNLNVFKETMSTDGEFPVRPRARWKRAVWTMDWQAEESFAFSYSSSLVLGVGG